MSRLPWRRLAGPVPMLAVALLVLNDHVFKWTWPGWWTGKLSDLAGVALVAVLAALVTGVQPALALTALGFTLLKTVPVVAVLAEPVLGGPVRQDWTDLVALAVLWPVGLWLQRASLPATIADRHPRRSAGHARLWTTALALLTAATAAVGVTATSCAPLPAIVTVVAVDGSYYAREGALIAGPWARSEDKGVTWQDSAAPPGPVDGAAPGPVDDAASGTAENAAPGTAATPEPAEAGRPVVEECADGTCYRINGTDVPGRVERQDGAGDWRTVHEVPAADLDAISTGCAKPQTGVFANLAVLDRDHAAVSLGADGVLVGSPDGWQQTQVLGAPPRKATVLEQGLATGLVPFGGLLVVVLWLTQRAGWGRRLVLVGIVFGAAWASLHVADATAFMLGPVPREQIVRAWTHVALTLATAALVVPLARPRRRPSGPGAPPADPGETLE